LLSSEDGIVIVPAGLFADADHAHMGLMEAAHSDASLVRFISVDVPSRRVAQEWARRRAASGWSLTNLEAKLYGSMHALVAAYSSEDTADVEDATGILDLASGSSEVVISLCCRNGATG
jgi:hypothetical protein